MTIRVTLPWPSRALAPNSRLSWQAKLSPKKQAREAGFYAARAVYLPDDCPITGRLRATFYLYPRSKRRYDVDNTLAALKSTIDGVCQGLCIDDSQIIETTIKKCDVYPGGRIILEIEEV